MAIETREKEINGSVYAVTQLPARRAIRMKAKLIKLLGPVIAQLYVTISDKKGDEQIAKDNVVKAIELLAQNLNEVDFENMCVELLQGVRKNGIELVPAIIDMEFAGDLATLYQVIWFVLEVNYSSFFELLSTGNALTDTQQAQVPLKKTFVRH